jgi:hypothetical protein
MLSLCVVGAGCNLAPLPSGTSPIERAVPEVSFRIRAGPDTVRVGEDLILEGEVRGSVPYTTILWTTPEPDLVMLSPGPAACADRCIRVTGLKTGNAWVLAETSIEGIPAGAIAVVHVVN